MSTYFRGVYVNYLKIYDISGEKITILLTKLSEENVATLFGMLVKNVDSVGNNEDFIRVSKGDVSKEIFTKLAFDKDFNEGFSVWNVVKLLILILIAIIILFYVALPKGA